jgi:uncharacterized membrane protein YcaP (DUF421 family)
VDPLRIVARCVFAYVVLLVFVRLSGKRSVKHAHTFDFVLALVLGDMIDDVLWAEAGASAFVVATGVLMTVHTVVDLLRFRTGALR